MIEFTLTRTTTASIDIVFDTMTDHRQLADYVWMFRRSTLDREGRPAPNGVGAISASWRTRKDALREARFRPRAPVQATHSARRSAAALARWRVPLLTFRTMRTAARAWSREVRARRSS